jgi:hypothetical protein
MRAKCYTGAKARMQTINFEMDRDFNFLEIYSSQPHEQAHNYLRDEEAAYHADMKWRVEDYVSAYTFEPVSDLTLLVDGYDAGLLLTRKTGERTFTTGVARQHDGTWQVTMGNNYWFRGKVKSTLVTTPLNSLFSGWGTRLDRNLRILRLDTGDYLNERDLYVLNKYLMGVPRKVTANEWGVSVKAVEKRLSKIKDKLRHKDCWCHSLHGCIHYHQLTSFLLECSNWFELKPHVNINPQRRADSHVHKPFKAPFCSKLAQNMKTNPEKYTLITTK